MNIPITQSESWQKLQEALGETAHREETKDYTFLAVIKSTPLGNYLYLPYGPVADTKEGMAAALDAIKDLAGKERAFFIRIEPQNKNIKLPASAIKTKDLNPAETWALDLPSREEAAIPADLKAKLPSRLLRYYKSAAKKGITIEKSHNPEDIKHLLNLQRELAREKGISTFSEKYLKTELSQPFATLYLVKYHDPESKEEPQLVAAGLVFDDKTTRYNLQGAQSDLGRRLHATGILTIQLILDAYDKGLKYFDFWGIAPEGAPDSHPWAGFTAFKKTFAGYEKSYHGTYDLVLSPLKYQLYRLLRTVNRLKRSMKK